jgi:hypothetical protein
MIAVLGCRAGSTWNEFAKSGTEEDAQSGVSELDYATASGTRQTGKNELSEPRDFSGVGSSDKFAVSRVGEAYDARVRRPNRKFGVR